MPELPEVENTVSDLRKKVLKRTFLNVWTDAPNLIRKPRSFPEFKKKIVGQTIKEIWRRGKNIIFELLNGEKLLIHQKLTGHLLWGQWDKKNGVWISKIPGPLLDDPMNKFLHLIFYLDNHWQLALSDLRKFAKVELLNKEELEKELDKLGLEPLAKEFTFEKMKEKILKKKGGEIKKVLMDQSVIAGIGNIYSDEILWETKIHPLKKVKDLSEEDFKNIYQAIKKILPQAIKLGGESFSDYRRPSGEKGNFDKIRKVYQREGEKCFRCGSLIKRIKINGRSAHYCPRCQVLK